MIVGAIGLAIAGLLAIIGVGAFIYDLFKGNLEIHERV